MKKDGMKYIFGLFLIIGLILLLLGLKMTYEKKAGHQRLCFNRR